jgi:lipopolysaccharide/colanic/teichoic acid biosynthesis glycosyltransferase
MTRLRDILASLLGIMILLPILAAVSTVVRLRLGSPVLFCQTRPGLHGKPFMLRKFRTMRTLGAGEDPLATDAVRLTRLGRFLRSTSLDELPTLWNVLRGDMSLVGPRPLLPEYLPLYTARQMRRHEVKPGITGWAQVNGRNAISWEEKFELDFWYVEHRSFYVDLKILHMTVWQVLARRDIAADGHATMPQFKGIKSVGGSDCRQIDLINERREHNHTLKCD